MFDSKKGSIMNDKTRVLTLRLNAEVTKELDRLADLYGFNTASKTIEHLIMRFDEVVEHDTKSVDARISAELELADFKSSLEDSREGLRSLLVRLDQGRLDL